MSITTTAHINLQGDARAALDFYQSVFGGEIMMFTNEQAGFPADQAQPEQLAWGQVESPAGFRIMAYDVRSDQQWEPGIIPFFVSVRGTDADEVRGYWDGLASDSGSTVLADLGPAQWSPLYGMVRDRFGITWVMDAAAS